MRKEEEKQVYPQLRDTEPKAAKKKGSKQPIRQRGWLVNLSPLYFIILVLLIGFTLVASQSGHTASPQVEVKKTEPKKIEVAPTKSEAPAKFNVGDFVYSSEGRRDPFQPLPLARLRDNKLKKTAKKGYELEELKIVGLLKTDKNKYVMMEDVQGKGITFHKGDYLNSNLWIVDVLDGNVVFGYKLKEEIKKFTVDVPRK